MRCVLQRRTADEQQIIDAGAYLANSPRKIVGFDTETTGVRLRIITQSVS